MSKLDLRTIYKSLSVKQLTNDEEKEIKIILKDMLLDIVELCEKNNINYTLGGGTALGSVRHQGFIPWDDDIDINVYRKDYLTLLNLIKEKYNQKYEINAPNFSSHPKTRFAKIYRKNTKLIQIIDFNNPEPNGIFIDIFPIEHVPNNKILYILHGLLCTSVMCIASCVYSNCYDIRELQLLMKRKNRLYYIFRKLVAKIFSFYTPEKWFCIVDKINSIVKNSNYLSSPTGRKHYFGEKIKFEDYFPACYGKFDGIDVRLPKNYDFYLTNLFGNYQIIPKKEEIEKHYIVEYKNFLK